MSGFVWLASYPKSGNTWFRMLVANLYAQGDEPADINSLPEAGGMASARAPFDYLLMADSGLLTHDEIDCLRPRLYEQMACGVEVEPETDLAREARLVKVHDAYTLTPRGEKLLAGAKKAIVIVRDPRAVAPALAHHNHVTIDQAIDLMNDPNATYCASNKSQPRQLRQKLLSWSGHVESWLNQQDIPIYLLRYEDMKANPVDVFLSAIHFAGRDVVPDQAMRAVDLADFSRLQAQEQEMGFRESSRGRVFFRKGQSDSWKEELTPEQITRIETAHGSVMARLGYR